MVGQRLRGRPGQAHGKEEGGLAQVPKQKKTSQKCSPRHGQGKSSQRHPRSAAATFCDPLARFPGAPRWGAYSRATVCRLFRLGTSQRPRPSPGPSESPPQRVTRQVSQTPRRSFCESLAQDTANAETLTWPMRWLTPVTSAFQKQEKTERPVRTDLSRKGSCQNP